MEILQTFIFPYLGYDDLCNLKETKNSRLKEIVDDFISPGKTNSTLLFIIRGIIKLLSSNDALS